MYLTSDWISGWRVYFEGYVTEFLSTRVVFANVFADVVIQFDCNSTIALLPRKRLSNRLAWEA